MVLVVFVAQGAQYRFPGRVHDLLCPQPQALGVLLKFLPVCCADAQVPGWRGICQVLDMDWWPQHSPWCPCPRCSPSPAELAVDVLCVGVSHPHSEPT